MRFISRKDTLKKNVSSGICVEEYALLRDDVSIATVLIDGRYPEQGYVANEKCEQFYLVMSGCGIVYFEEEEIVLKKGDLCLFEQGQKYRVKGDALNVVVINRPAWSAKQAVYGK